MALESVFIKAADTVFSIFKEAVRSGTYFSILDTGFVEDNVAMPVTVVVDSFAEEDIKDLSFSELIQPQDARGLIRGKEITKQPHANSDKLTVVEKDGTTSTYSVVAYSVDPMRILFTFLLRKT